MNYLIKNNRLTLENPGIVALSEVPQKKLTQMAKKYQIGMTVRVVDRVPTMRKGREVMKRVTVNKPRGRKGIEDEIRQRLAVTLEIPSEFWTKDQREFMSMNNVLDIKDVAEEEKLKKQVGIRISLPPYEKTKDRRKEAEMLFEVTDSAWNFLKDSFNFTLKEVKDENGKIFSHKKVKRPLLVIAEELPEEVVEEITDDIEEPEKKS